MLVFVVLDDQTLPRIVSVYRQSAPLPRFQTLKSEQKIKSVLPLGSFAKDTITQVDNVLLSEAITETHKVAKPPMTQPMAHTPMGRLNPRRTVL